MSQTKHGHGDTKATRPMTPEEMERLLREYPYGVMGLSHQDQPYVVPVSYRYQAGTIYIHGPQGKKMEYLRHNDKVCFEVDQVEIDENGQSGAWACVICDCTASIKTDTAAKQEWYRVVTGREPGDETTARLEQMDTGFVFLKIDEMSGRCRTSFKF